MCCCCSFSQETPAEEDAQIVDKILAMRRMKKKVINQVTKVFEHNVMARHVENELNLKNRFHLGISH